MGLLSLFGKKKGSVAEVHYDSTDSADYADYVANPDYVDPVEAAALASASPAEEPVSAVLPPSAPLPMSVPMSVRPTDSVLIEMETPADLATKSAPRGGAKLPPETKAIPVVTSPPVEPSFIFRSVPTRSSPAAPLFTKIAHVCLYVSDLERSMEYYARLGFKRRFLFNKSGKLYGAYLEFGESNFIELFEDPTAVRTAGNNNGRLAHFCLETGSIEAVMKSLTAAGVEFTPKKFGCDATYQIWLKDPDGNDFEIHQYTPKSSQLIGGDIEADW